MTDGHDKTKSKASIIYEWWRDHLLPRTQKEVEDSADKNAKKPRVYTKREQGDARALSAKLRRGTFPEMLFERDVMALAHQLKCGPHELKRFCQILSIIAEIRDDDKKTLPQLLGQKLKRNGDEEKPLMSPVRFRSLLTAGDEERIDLLRRAVRMTGRGAGGAARCNVVLLARDLLYWNEDTRARWCFHYFGGDAPDKKDEAAA